MKKINLKFFIIFLSFTIISSFYSWIITFANWNLKTNTWITLIDNFTKNNPDEYSKLFEKYIEYKKENSDNWISFMSILSTLFAVFFVYSSFKIDNDLKEMNWKVHLLDAKNYELLEKLEKAYNIKIEELNKKTEKEKEEINQKNEEEKNELKNENKFIKMINYYNNEIIEKWNYDDIIEWLKSLLNEDYILNDNDKYNTLLFYLSKAYYWKWFKEWEKFDTIENLSQAIIYANEAIEDPSDPYKNMLISRFNEFNNNFNS